MDIREPPHAPVARRRLVAALAVTLAAWVPAAIAGVLSVVYGIPVVAQQEFASLYLLNAVVWGGVAGLLLARRPTPVGAIVAVTAIGSGVSALTRQLVRSPLGDGIPLGLAEHTLDRLWMPGTLATLSILPLLLTSRPLGARTRALVVVGLAVAVVPLVVGSIRQRPGAAANPLAIEALQDAVVVIFPVALTISVALAIVTDAVLLWRWRRGPADDRRGTGWLVVGQTAQILFFGPTFLPWFPIPAQQLFQSFPLAPVLALVFMAAAVVVVALGGRLWGIDTTVNRVVVEVLLLVVVVLGVISLAFPFSTSLPVPPTIAGVAAVVGLALVLEPLRRFLQRRVDALVYGDAADPAQLLARLGTAPSDGRVLDALVTELRDALRLESLEVRPADEPVPAADPGRHHLVLTLRGAAGDVGWVRATPTGRQRIDPRTRRVLEGISGVLAVALQLDGTHRELAEARDRVLAVGDEERRMLRRELREGLEPDLAASAVRLAALGTLETSSPTEARAALGRIRTDLADSTTDVRDLARTLLPGALDAGDLDAAVRELARRFSGDRLEIDVRSERAGELAVAQQNAVHHLAAEAVLLLRRASGARHATLSLEVRDDLAIVGLDADAPFAAGSRAAVSVRSISERADELGGRVEVRGDGTGIHVEVPR